MSTTLASGPDFVQAAKAFARGGEHIAPGLLDAYLVEVADRVAEEVTAAVVDWGDVYIRLQPKAAEALALAAGVPAFPPPLPSTSVKVRSEVPCPACGDGRVSQFWRVERRALIAGSGCRRRHVFVMALPPYLEAEA
ncbi:hypothetical protein CTZ27_24925 [Streptomyces griseocarneus]|nr:hypothetical protein CTZ27_24925 [Streptomyces griseocarneus]